MLSAFDVSMSALTAERTRLNAIAGNIANLSTTRNEDGEIEPYKPRYVVFQTDNTIPGPPGTSGVRVAAVEIEDVSPHLKYQPGHPDAGPDGYVAYPGINQTQQFVDAIEATRAYEANVGVMEVTKDLARQTLRILA